MPRWTHYKERFWMKVKRSSECWEWIGCLSGTGYGNFYANGKLYLTHRYSWEEEYGVIPYGLCVLHKCDNRACVRPSHLFLGTKKQNTADMFSKGRQRNLGIMKGQDHGEAKLKNEDVLRIRLEVAAGRKQKDLAAELGVSISLVSLIVRRRAWCHL